MAIQMKLISSQEKCFMEEMIYLKPAMTHTSCLRGEDFHFQIVCTTVHTPGWVFENPATLVCRSELTATFERVEQIPVRFPCYPIRNDENYLRKTPGLYPDLLTPLAIGDSVSVPTGILQSIYATVHVPEETRGGDYPVTVGFAMEDGTETVQTFTLHVVDAVLPKQEIAVAQWMHYDCIADAHGIEIFSEAHWEAMANYIRMAVEHGVNTIMTPVVTPPLDTAVGGERPTVQLVDIEKTGDEYHFGFDKLRRFVAMCLDIGVRTFEIAHLFTQWGAYHAPKIMATVDGEYKRIFGWDTDAASDEYIGFLRAFLTALIAEMKALGVDDRMIFHISDEPNEEQLEQYLTVKSKIADLLEEYPLCDALSDFAFYEKGVVKRPIPASNHIEPFLEAKVEDLWTYYCCGQWRDVSNRFIAMPLARERIIGTQFWKYHIVGFLHWGFNFWYSRYSKRQINPFINTDADCFAPAGDAFSVYPAPDNKPYRSLRLVAFREALYDLSAMKLAEELCGREAVRSLLEEQGEVTFSSYPKDAEFLLSFRDRLNRMIEAHLA
ncbi:MAG: DUF4091 domain-containing protein [Clostridia bacterium]|nr:DUF4091 domain-containing protein [Clostridia bacterium]